jgi:molecular chaperone Hsp33
MVQVLPGAEEPLIRAVEERIRNTPSVSGFLEAHRDARSAMETLFDGMGIEWFEDVGFSFSCRCSRELARVLLVESMGKEKPEEAHEVRCHFCGTSYLFTAEELTGGTREGSAPIDEGRGE